MHVLYNQEIDYGENIGLGSDHLFACVRCICFLYTKCIFLPNTVVPLYVATLTRGHPFYEATISVNILCIIVFDIPLTRGHPSNKARFSNSQGWPYKRGTTVYVIYDNGCSFGTVSNL